MSGRWGFCNARDFGTPDDPYLDRFRIVQTPWFGAYLHHIHRPDKDRDPHDHPWWFASLVLCGSYQEMVWPDKTTRARFAGTATVAARSRNRWSLRAMNRRAAHMITDISGPLWTLVLVGRDHGGWGFWRLGEYVAWQDYAGREEVSDG